MAELRDEARGRWKSILLHFGFTEAQLSKRNGPCPFCEGTDRWRWTDHESGGFGICNACAPPEESVDGVLLLQRLRGWDFATAAREIRAVLGVTVVEQPKPDDTEKRRADIARVWSESLPLAPLDPVHRYLATTRGLRGIRFGALTNIRHHPALPYYDGETVTHHPAMVAMAMTATGRCATLHRTYLTPTGEKADVPTVRKYMPRANDWAGGAVRLGIHEPGNTIIVGEGIESTLAYALRRPGGVPWAALDANHLAAFVPPPGARVIVAADNDASFTGQRVAFDLAARLVAAGHSVSVAVPPDAGSDWADHVRRDQAGRAAS